MGRQKRRPQRSAAARTLPLPTFEPQISRERAFELVRSIPIGTRLAAHAMKCRKPTCHCADGPGHGPYWQAYGLGRALYIGTDESKAELEVAWRMVGAELAAAQANVDATPEGQALAKLLALIAYTPRPPQKKASEPAPAATESAA